MATVSCDQTFHNRTQKPIPICEARFQDVLTEFPDTEGEKYLKSNEM